MSLSSIDTGNNLNSRAGHLLVRDHRTDEYRVGFVELDDGTVVVFHNKLTDALRVRRATGDTLQCTSCPDIFQIYARGGATDEFKSIEIAVCRECAKGIWDYHHVRNDGECKCQLHCGRPCCDKVAQGHNPQINISTHDADAMLTDDDAEAGVDPARRLVPPSVSPARTIAYGSEGSPCPSTCTVITGAAVGQPVDAREALSILSKKLDEADKKDHEIAMLQRQVQELNMQIGDLQTRTLQVTQEANTFFECAVFPDEDMQDDILHGGCGHKLSLTAVQGMLRAQNVVAAVGTHPVRLTCPVCRQVGLWSPLRNLKPLLNAIRRLGIPLPEFVEAPSNRRDHAYNSPSDSE